MPYFSVIYLHSWEKLYGFSRCLQIESNNHYILVNVKMLEILMWQYKHPLYPSYCCLLAQPRKQLNATYKKRLKSALHYRNDHLHYINVTI